ncbi:cyclodeaminase/cyclohydrolase family protein [Candidatus Aerophobetes bacterium]|nr:cyclodeaminase/cyclohydrolase family protein [Candidatus Aerophobetes bacterium]
MYLERPLREFIADTSSRTPTPGGGSVAALVGALGSSLLSMVGNFTLDKEKFKSAEEEVQNILKELNLFTSKLCSLLEDDISAYQNFFKVSSLPKKTREEKQMREKLLQEALKKAAEVPFKTCELSFSLLNIASRLLEIGNPRLISDVGVGAILAQACLESAALNVEINLSYIKDQLLVKGKRESLASLLEKGNELTSKIVNKVQEALRV